MAGPQLPFSQLPLPPLVLADSRTADVQSDPLPESTAPKISRSIEAGLAVCGLRHALCGLALR